MEPGMKFTYGYEGIITHKREIIWEITLSSAITAIKFEHIPEKQLITLLT